MNGNNWIIKQNINKVKRWVNNKLVRGMYIQNYPWDVVREKYEKKSQEMLDDPFIIIVQEGDLIYIIT